jgi:hypothetical protein
MAAVYFYAILVFLLHILIARRVVSLVISHATGGDKYHLFRLLQDKVGTGIAALTFCLWLVCL